MVELQTKEIARRIGGHVLDAGTLGLIPQWCRDHHWLYAPSSKNNKLIVIMQPCVSSDYQFTDCFRAQQIFSSRINKGFSAAFQTLEIGNKKQN